VPVTARCKRPVLALAGVAGLTLAGVMSAVPANAATSATYAVSGVQPSWASHSADRGAVNAKSAVTTRIYLAGRNPAGLAAYASAVSDPSSSSYGRFLSAKQVQARYGATAAQRSLIKSWAASSHLKVTGSTDEYIAVSGSASAVGKAFHTALHNYSTSQGTAQAPDSAVSLPTSLRSAVLTISGLSTDISQNKPTSVPQTSIPIGSKPVCSAYFDQDTATGLPAVPSSSLPYSQCPFIPSQLRQAYGVTSTGLTGKGATIAVVDAYGSSTMLSDANRYATDTGDQPFAAGQYTEDVTPADWTTEHKCGGPAGWAPEESLDVEMAHGLAPSADVVYVGANSCGNQSFIDAFNNIVDNHLADIVTNSWGSLIYSTKAKDGTTAGQIKEYEQVFQRAAIEGIGFQFSAGDCGDSSPGAAASGVNCDPNTPQAQANYPDSDPWVTSVGGTWLATSTKKGTYETELSMGNSLSLLSTDGKSWSPFPGNFYFGGGGGTSDVFAQPGYQKGIVPASLADTLATGAPASSPRRVTPDVAVQGDISNATLVGISDGSPYTEQGYGGTSVSSPEFAGILADAIQAQGGRAIGFANPALYDRQSTYHDVQAAAKQYVVIPLQPSATGAVRAALFSIGDDYGLQAGPGYDDATGLGSPTAKFLKSFE
jgi:subtilase family serine protease